MFSFSTLSTPPSIFGFFGAASSVARNYSILSNKELTDVAFLVAVNTMRDSGILTVLMGSGVSVLAMAGLGAAGFLCVGWAISGSGRGRSSNNLEVLAAGVLGGAASYAALSYGSYKIGEGIAEVGLAITASAYRR